MDHKIPRRPRGPHIRLDTRDADFCDGFASLLAQARDTTDFVAAAVASIIAEVRLCGDAALCALTERFDRTPLTPDRLRLAEAEIDQAVESVSADLMAALLLAAERIEVFHRAQIPADCAEDTAGVQMGMRWTPSTWLEFMCPAARRPTHPRC